LSKKFVFITSTNIILSGIYKENALYSKLKISPKRSDYLILLLKWCINIGFLFGISLQIIDIINLSTMFQLLNCAFIDSGNT